MVDFKKLKRVALISLISLASLVICMGILGYIYQDKIISIVVSELNKKLKTPVKVQKIDFTIWSKFPDVAVRFSDLEIEESIQPQLKPLLKAKDVYLTFNLFNFFSGNYKINDLYIESGEAFLRRNKKGEINYDVIKKQKVPPLAR